MAASPRKRGQARDGERREERDGRKEGQRDDRAEERDKRQEVGDKRIKPVQHKRSASASLKRLIVRTINTDEKRRTLEKDRSQQAGARHVSEGRGESNYHAESEVREGAMSANGANANSSALAPTIWRRSEQGGLLLLLAYKHVAALAGRLPLDVLRIVYGTRLSPHLSLLPRFA
jgi:hypothetical protein